MIVGPPMRPAMAQSDRPSFTQVMMRRKLWIATPVILMAAGALMTASALPPRYHATAVLAIDARKVQVIEINSVVSPLSGENAALRSELDAIASRSMAELVADDLNLWENPDVLRALYSPTSVSQVIRGRLDEFTLLVDEFVAPYWESLPIRHWWAGDDASVDPTSETGDVLGDEADHEGITRSDIVDWVLGGLDVSNDGRSLTIYVTFASIDPELSALIANAYVEAYLHDQVALKVRTTQNASNWLGERLVELRTNLEESEAAVSRFRREENLLEVNGESLAGQEVAGMSAQLAAAKGERSSAEAVANAARALLNGDPAAGAHAEILNSPEAAALRTNLFQVNAQLAELRRRGAHRHPKTLDLEAQKESLTRQLAAETARIVKALENEARAARAREAQLAANFEALETRLGQGGEASVRLNQLIREAEANRALYESFLTRYKETIEQEGLATPDARILSRAEPPHFPSGPSTVPLLLMGIVSGFGIGGLLAAIREKLDSRLYRVSDIEALSSVPVVGVLPRLPRWRSPEIHVLGRRPSAFVEALQRTHTTFTLSRGSNSASVIAVTSAVPGEGKTSFAAAWARYLALGGASVLLIDADLHRPRLAKLLRIRSEATTTDVLREAVTLDEAVVVDERSGALVLSARPASGDCSLLVRPAQLKRLIADAKDRYDYVIIDTPPATAAPDAAVVAAYADSVLFLVRSRRTPRKAFIAALRFLRLCGVKLEGIIVTDARPGTEAYPKGEYYSAGGFTPMPIPGLPVDRDPLPTPIGGRHWSAPVERAL